MSITVVIADDHPIIRSGVRGELAHHIEFEIIGEAVNGDEALHLATELNPDVLLLDINMPGLKTIKILETLKNRPVPSKCKIIILSAYGDTATVSGMLRAGADGYILKEEDPSIIPKAILEVIDGKTWVSESAYE